MLVKIQMIFYRILFYAISLGYSTLLYVGYRLFISVWMEELNHDQMLRIILIAMTLFIFYAFMARRLLIILSFQLNVRRVRHSNSIFRGLFFCVYVIHIIIAIIAVLE